MLYRVAALLSAPCAETTSGRYYWTHNLYLDTADYPTPVDMRNVMWHALRWGYTHQVLYYGSQGVNPVTGAVVWTENFATPDDGELPNSENYSLIIAARWRFWGEDGSYSYHLHRAPTDTGWIADGVWSEDMPFSFGAMINSMLVRVNARTHTGSPIDRWEVEPQPIGWQLRHGTKRRNNRFWLP